MANFGVNIIMVSCSCFLVCFCWSLQSVEEQSDTLCTFLYRLFISHNSCVRKFHNMCALYIFVTLKYEFLSLLSGK
uniref:Putative secreted protein n=1 Tax=Ixodes ricinus TaxID=34613 RepID=A0A6B0U454_IXORI